MQYKKQVKSVLAGDKQKIEKGKPVLKKKSKESIPKFVVYLIIGKMAFYISTEGFYLYLQRDGMFQRLTDPV